MDFKVRMMRDAEWDALCSVAKKTGIEFHWRDMGSICLDRKDSNTFRTFRGFFNCKSRDITPANTRDSLVGFRPVFEPLMPDDAPNGTIIFPAALFIDGAPAKQPDNPSEFGDIPEFNPGSKLEFRDPIEREECNVKAVKVGAVYVADRCVVTAASWDDLVAQGFGYSLGKAWMPFFADYLEVLQKTKIPVKWAKMYSWLADSPGARCGFLGKKYTEEGRSDIRNERVGFRPMFEAPGVPDGEYFAAATLYLDGTPVKVPQQPDYEGDIPEYIPRTKIDLRPPLTDPAYQIWACSAGGKMVADRCVLRNVSWDDLDSQGF